MAPWQRGATRWRPALRRGRFLYKRERQLVAAGKLLASLGVSPAGLRPRVAVSLGSGRVGRQDGRCAVPGAFLSLLLLQGETKPSKTRVLVLILCTES